MSEGDLSFIKVVAFFGGIIAVAWLIRRYIREHHQDKVQWWMQVVVPRAKRWAVWIFGITMLLWVIVHATAPEDARDDLTRQIKELFQSAPDSDGAAPAASPEEPKP